MRDWTVLFVFHFFVATSCVALDSQLLYKRFRSKTSLAIVAGAEAEGNPFLCSAAQTSFIQNAIKWMNYYAESSSEFLLKDDAEKTAAFVGWFGYSNQDLVSDIKLNIFDPIHGLGSGATTYVSSLQERDGIVSIGCGTAEASRICRTEPQTIAYARTKDNTVVICPVAFSNNGFYGTDAGEQAAQSAWASRVAQPSAGLALLHEMTHLPGVVGGFEHWTSAPQDGSHDYFYPPSKCITLNNIAKLNNAQNYAFFALDITANRQYASREIDEDAPNKEQDAIWWLREGAGGKRESP